MGLRFTVNILKVIFDLRISCTDTVKSWYGGHWNSGIPWNSGQNCTYHFLLSKKPCYSGIYMIFFVLI